MAQYLSDHSSELVETIFPDSEKAGYCYQSLYIAHQVLSHIQPTALLLDARFFVSELTWNIQLRKMQVVPVGEFVEAIWTGKYLVKQMIMGAAKTTVVGPLLTVMLASPDASCAANFIGFSLQCYALYVLLYHV
jgi:hypothetical protein